jgi:hypothetical protein
MAKSKVLERPMFKGAMPDEPVMDVENVGIMQGFKDLFEDEDPLMPEEDMEMAELLGRTPDSPEILMNNLRGDMRSVDARRDELADLVGFQAAEETPEPVLAMLQPVLAQQGGIGALPVPGAMPPGPPPMPPGPETGMMPPEMGMPPGPEMGGMPPPEMMPPGPSPEGMPPGGIAGLPAGQPPLQMAQGGPVQYFRDGSDEDGVTPGEDSSSGFASLPPELVERSRQEVYDYVARQPATIPALKGLAEQRAREYREILGTDRNAAQAQMLLELGQRAFGYAANVDDQGRPLRGGQLARLAGAVRTLPTAVGKFTAEMDKEDRALKLAGIQAAEKERESIREANAKLVENQRRTFVDILKKAGGADSLFGKGAWEWRVVNTPGLLARYAAGETNEDETNLIDSSISRLRERSMPRVETYKDAGGTLREIKYPAAPFPAFVQEAIDIRAGASRPRTTAAPQPTTTAPTTTPTTGGVTGVTTAGATGQRQAMPGAAGSGLTIERPPEFQPGGVPMPAPQEQEAPSMVPRPPDGMNRIGAFNPQRQGLYQMASNIAGPGAWAASKISGVPGLGDPFPQVTQAMSNARVAVEDLIEATLKSQLGGIKEQEQLRRIYTINPEFFKDPAAYQSQLVALDNVLEDRLYKELKNANDKTLAEKDQLASREVVRKITNLRERFNIIPKVFSAEEALQYPGQTVLWYGVERYNVPKNQPQR